MERRIHSVATLADHWGCGTDTIYALVKSGELPHFKLGGKLIRIRSDEVDAFERRGAASVDTPSLSARAKRDDATDIRLERLVDRPHRRAARS